MNVGSTIASLIVLCEVSLLIRSTCLHSVDAVHVRNFRMDAGIRKSAILCDALALKAEWSEVREGIVAGVVVIGIAANERAECEHGVGVDQMRPAWSDIECADLRTLILGTDGLATLRESTTRGRGRSKSAVGNDDAKPRRGVLRVERIRSLKPGTRVENVEVDSVCWRESDSPRDRRYFPRCLCRASR